jgi:N-acetylneuraminic acid mutarotase
MSRSVVAMFALLFMVASCMAVKPALSSVDASAENTWVSKASMQVARSGLGVAVVNGKIYAIGGSTESGFAPSLYPSHVYATSARGVSTNEEYDPETNTWTYKTPMPTPRLAFATAVYKNKIYCIGGQANSTRTRINEVYDPETDTWETKAPMPTPRNWVTANVVNGKIYLMGGYTPYPSTLNEVYDPETDAWSTKTPSPDAPITDSSLASCVFDNNIFLFGGLTQDQHYQLNQIYDTVTDRWSAGAYPPSSLGGGAAAATTGAFAPKRIYAIGPAPIYNPEGAPSYTNRVYYPRTDSWSAAVDMPTTRFNFGIAVVNDAFYVIGGHTYTFPGNFAPTPINEQYMPFGYGTPDPSYDSTAPDFSVVLPGNETYFTADVGLNFTVDEPVFSVHYVLDGGVPVEVSGNATLAELPIGAHNVTVFGFDASGNMGTSETVCFAVAAPEPFPVVPVAAASAASVAVAVAGLLVYFKKHRR